MNPLYGCKTHTPISRPDLTIQKPGPVKQYKLPPEEWEKYKKMPPPKEYKRVSTTASQKLVSERRLRKGKYH